MMMFKVFENVTPVSTYTRANAIADGVLVDVSRTAKEAGFRFPVAVTAAVWSDCVAWNEEDSKRQVPQDEEGRLWDVVYMCYQMVRHANVMADTFYFVVYRVPRGGKGMRARQVRLKACIGPGDSGTAVITIMQPNES